MALVRAMPRVPARLRARPPAMGPMIAPMLSAAVENDPDIVGAVSASAMIRAISALPTVKDRAPCVKARTHSRAGLVGARARVAQPQERTRYRDQRAPVTVSELAGQGDTSKGADAEQRQERRHRPVTDATRSSGDHSQVGERAERRSVDQDRQDHDDL